MKIRLFVASVLAFSSFLGMASRVNAVDTVAPTLITPSAVDYVFGRDSLVLRYNIPETPSNGTVQIRWWLASESNADTTYRQLVMDNTNGIVETAAFNFIGPDADLLSIRQIARVETFIGGVKQSSTASLPSGKYTFVLIYQNALLGAAASVRISNVGLFQTCGAGTSSTSGYTPCTTNTTTTSSTTSTTSTTTSTSTTTTTTPIIQEKSVSLCTGKKGKVLSRNCLTTNAHFVLAPSSKMTVAVSKASAKICKISGQSVRALQAGSCWTILTVTPKKGRPKSYKSKVVITN